MKTLRILIIACILLSSSVRSQLSVLGGTTVVINSGTTLKSVSNDTIHVFSGALFQNDGILDMDSTTYLNDTLAPLFGVGYEHFYQNVVPITQTSDLGGLGYRIGGIDTLLNFDLKRYHSPIIISGTASVERYYEIISSTQNVYTVNVRYDDSELGFNSESGLVLASSNDSGFSWNWSFGIVNLSDDVLNNCSETFFGIHTLIDSSNFTNIEALNEPIFSIFPNPAENGSQVVISSLGAERINLVRIYSIAGRKLGEMTLDGHEQKANFQLPNGLPKGTYWLEIQSNNVITVKQLVIL